MRGDAGVHGVGQLGFALFKGLDDGCGVDSSRGSERVGAKYRIAGWNRHLAGARHDVAILFQLDEIMINEAEKLQIHQNLIHGRVTHALPDAECAAMDDIRSSLHGSQRVDHAQTAIVVAVPTDHDLLTRRFDDILDDELDQGTCPRWRGMSDRVR